MKSQSHPRMHIFENHFVFIKNFKPVEEEGETLSNGD